LKFDRPTDKRVKMRHKKEIGRRKNCWIPTNFEEKTWILSNVRFITHQIPPFWFPVAMTATFFTINISFRKYNIFRGCFCCCSRPHVTKTGKVIFYLETQECFLFLKLAVSAAFKRTGYNRPVSLLLGKWSCLENAKINSFHNFLRK